MHPVQSALREGHSAVARRPSGVLDEIRGRAALDADDVATSAHRERGEERKRSSTREHRALHHGNTGGAVHSAGPFFWQMSWKQRLSGLLHGLSWSTLPTHASPSSSRRTHS